LTLPAPTPPVSSQDIVRLLTRRIVVLIGTLGLVSAWAVAVPLATSVHTPGKLSSTAPEYEVQHPLGGRIAEVMVAPLDRVSTGQLLIRLDVKRERDQLAELRAEIAQLNEENATISAVLSVLGSGNDPETGVQGPYWMSFQRHVSERRAARATIAALEDQLEFARSELGFLQDRVASIAARDTRNRSLAERGLLAGSARDELHEAKLQAEVQMSASASKFQQTVNDIRRQELELELKQAQFRESLTAAQAQNARRLPGLRREIISLEDRIAQAKVVSPADGIVSTLEYNSVRMFAPQGATLLSIAQPLNAAQIEFDVSPMQVDQVHVGMNGILAIPSLPQRAMPKLRVEVTSLSPVASHDETGAPVSYRGRAQLVPGDAEKLAKLTETGTRLVSDMPVNISFSGRKTTFADYLIKPFLAGISQAMQD